MEDLYFYLKNERTGYNKSAIKLWQPLTSSIHGLHVNSDHFMSGHCDNDWQLGIMLNSGHTQLLQPFCTQTAYAVAKMACFISLVNQISHSCLLTNQISRHILLSLSHMKS